MLSTALRSLLAVLVLIPVVSAAEAPHGVQVRYDLGATMDGAIDGSCSALAILLPQGTAGSLLFEASQARLVEHTVQMNSTRAATPLTTPQEMVLAGMVDERIHPLASGAGELAWSDVGRALIVAAPSPFSNEDAAFDARFATSHLSSGVLRDATDTFTWYRPERPGVLIPTFDEVLGLQRPVAIADGTLAATGGLSIYVEGATVQSADGASRTVPPRYENVTRAGDAGLAEVFVSRLHYGFLQLTGARLELPIEGVQVVCQDLVADVHGSLRLSLAEGSLRRPEGDLAFAERELGLTGRMHWSERPEGRGVAAEGVGTLSAATIDFAPVHGSSVTLAEIGLWATVVAALASVLYVATKGLLGFFSRLTENQVAAHPHRALVLDAVRAQPNVTLHRLTSTTGLHKSVVRYHTRVLETKGLLRSHRVLHDRCFVARETVQAQGRSVLEPSLDLILRNDAALGHIRRSVPAEGVRFFQLAQRLITDLGMTKQGAWKAVLRAEAMGLVRRDRVGREVWIRCVP